MEPPLSIFLRRAKKESEKSVFPRFKVGAVLVRKGKVISRGHNRNKFDRLWGSGFSKTVHAESSAIRDALNRVNDLSGCTIYIYRRNGLLSRPCDCCMNHLISLGIRKIVFSYGSSMIGTIYLGSNNTNHVELREMQILQC